MAAVMPPRLGDTQMTSRDEELIDPAVTYRLAYVIALLLDSVHHAMR